MTHLSIYTVQEKLTDISRTTDWAYAGWDKAYNTLEAAKEAVFDEHARNFEIDPEDLVCEWEETTDGRWLGLMDNDPEDGIYAIVLTKLY